MSQTPQPKGPVPIIPKFLHISSVISTPTFHAE